MTDKMKILIAYDGSSCADAALGDIARAALPLECEATVLTVADVLMPMPVPPIAGMAPAAISVQTPAVAREWRERAFRAVDDAYSTAFQAAEVVRRKFPQWKVTPASEGDSPAWAIIKKAHDTATDLIIVGSHGRGALGRFFLGSVSQKVLSEAHCSVRIARGHASADDAARILIGIDASPGAEAAVRAVARRRWPEKSEALLIAAIPTLMVPAIELNEEMYEDEQGHLKTVLDRLAEPLREAGLSVSSLIKEGDPKRLLVEEAERWKADSIFVGARGLRRIERFLIGSVSYAVAARAHCSVEVVRE
jgi:nucleotide-binding universal stress UspA family protein